MVKSADILLPHLTIQASVCGFEEKRKKKKKKKRKLSALKIENFIRKALMFFLFLLDCGYTLERLTEAVLTSTHNLCLGAKLRKIVCPCIPQFFYIKVGYEGVYFSWTCFPDD